MVQQVGGEALACLHNESSNDDGMPWALLRLQQDAYGGAAAGEHYLNARTRYATAALPPQLSVLRSRRPKQQTLMSLGCMDSQGQAVERGKLNCLLKSVTESTCHSLNPTGED